MKLQLPPDPCPLLSTEFNPPPPNKIPGYATASANIHKTLLYLIYQCYMVAIKLVIKHSNFI